MPLNKRHLQIHTTYFDQQSNSIFKQSLNESSSQGSDLVLHKPLMNSKSQSLPQSQNVLYRTIQPQERSAEHHFGPDSQRLLDEFRQIVEGTPQIKSEVYESVVGPKEIGEGLSGKESLYRKISRTSQERGCNQMRLQQCDKRNILPEINVVESQQYMLSIKGYSPPDNINHSKPNLQPQTSFGKFSSKPISGTIQQLCHQQNPPNDKKITNLKKGHLSFNGTTGRQGFKEDYCVRGLQGRLHEREEERYMGRNSWEHEKTFKLGCDGVGGEWEGWVRRGVEQGWGVGNVDGMKQRCRWRSRSGRTIQQQLITVKQQYNRNISNLSTKLQQLQLYHPKFSPISQKRLILQQQRQAILNNIWSRLSINPEQNQFQTLNWVKSSTSTTGGRVKGRIEGRIEGRDGEKGNKSKVDKGEGLLNGDGEGSVGWIQQKQQQASSAAQGNSILIQQPTAQPYPDNYSLILQQLSLLRHQLQQLKHSSPMTPYQPHQPTTSYYISQQQNGSGGYNDRGLMTPIRKLEGVGESSRRVGGMGQGQRVDNGSGGVRNSMIAEGRIGKNIIGSNIAGRNMIGNSMTKGNALSLNSMVSYNSPNPISQPRHPPHYLPVSLNSKLSPSSYSTTTHLQTQYYPYTRSIVLKQLQESDRKTTNKGEQKDISKKGMSGSEGSRWCQC